MHSVFTACGSYNGACAIAALSPLAVQLVCDMYVGLLLTAAPLVALAKCATVCTAYLHQ